MTTPSTSFLIDLCGGLAQYLAEANIGLTYSETGVYTASQTGIAIMAVPPTPNRLVVLTPVPLGDDPTLANSIVGLQIRTRSTGADPRDVLALDDAIADQLLGNYPLRLSTGVQIGTLTRTSAVSLGQDDATPPRWGWSSNYRITVYRPGQHRL
jgi:hypothetical protein